MKLNRQAIQRMVDSGQMNIGGRKTGGSGVGGGGGVSASWVDENYVSKEFFSALFKVFNGTGSGATEIEPNDEMPTPDTNVNIEAMYGLWTERFLTAMGQGPDGSGGGGATYLSQLLDVVISNQQPGQVLTCRLISGQYKWVNEAPAQGSVTSVGMSVPTGIKVSNGSTQTITGAGTFAITYDTDYQAFKPTDFFESASANAAAKSAVKLKTKRKLWGNDFNGEADVNGDITMADGNRFIYFGTSNTDFYIKKISDRLIIKSNGTEVINIYNNKFYSAVQIHTTVGVLSDSYVTALSDIRKKDVIDRFCLDVDAIALASLIRFTWKDGHDKDIHAGGIAQEWQKILPEAVIETEDGSLAMDYGVIGMVSAVSLARKVQEQQKEIDDLKCRLEKIEKLLNL